MNAHNFQEVNPYESPEVVRAELVKPRQHKETIAEVVSRMMVWGGVTFIAIMVVMAATGVTIGSAEPLIAIVGFLIYWAPRLLAARR